MTRIHHVGITVGNLDETIDFYLDVSQGELVGPFEKRGPAIDAVTGHVGAVVRQAFIRVPEDETLIELLEYSGTTNIRIDPDNANTGAVHVGILVASVEAVMERMRTRGATLLSDPVTGTAGPMENHRFLYVLGPDNVRVELVEPPH